MSAAPAMAQTRLLAQQLAVEVRQPWTLMEVCGGQTHAFLRWGLDQLLPPSLRLIHGPGCPVCVTPAASIDQALALARRPEVILCSYGDMLRVPGSDPGGDLLAVRAGGGAVRLLTSPLQALGLSNLSLLVAHVRVVPAMEAILIDPANRVQGFLAAGHVGAVMGLAELYQLVQRHHVPVVVTGFEPQELMAGVLACGRQLEQGRAELENAYGQVVRPEGNAAAQSLIETVFEPVDRPWRGLGLLAGGGLALRGPYRQFDARRRFAAMADDAATDRPSTMEEGPCISGRILRGLAQPPDCPAFGRDCTPLHPLGAPMVSSEGACAAYHRYRAREAA